MTPLFSAPDDVRDRLAGAGYLADGAIATTVFLADALGKPLLVEGPAGVGKTELAKAVAAASGAGLVRLQCYEGLDEARALYEWNYKKQLLRIHAAQASERAPAGPARDATPAGGDPDGRADGRAGGRAGGWDAIHDDIFSEEFLLERPLLRAIRRTEPTVLLIDETDKADVEVEGLLLEVLSDFQVTIPELGTVTAARRPFVVLTSNATRELSEALKRRCLYLHLNYPAPERERDIVLTRVPGIEETLATKLVELVATLRALEIKKPPSIAETIDWARTLLALGLDDLDGQAVSATLGVVLKHVSDQERARKELDVAT
jgi:MoxR-like ATPase